MLAIQNIGELFVAGPGPVNGRSMRDVELIHDAALLIENDCIGWLGPETQLRMPAKCESLDADGGCVVPGLVDCHTHTVFAFAGPRDGL